jgi:hypothetical protein
VYRLGEIEAARAGDKAAAVQGQQPHLGVRAGRHGPLTGNIADLDLEELDVLDGGFAPRSHAGTQYFPIEVVGAKGRVLAEFFQVFDGLARNVALQEFGNGRRGGRFGLFLAAGVGAPGTEGKNPTSPAAIKVRLMACVLFW